MVQYCSVDCQRTHRPQHKRECKKRAAELFDIALFKQPAYCNIAYAYFEGGGVERDMKMAKHYWELAAIGGMQWQGTILALLRRTQAI